MSHMDSLIVTAEERARLCAMSKFERINQFGQPPVELPVMVGKYFMLNTKGMGYMGMTNKAYEFLDRIQVQEELVGIELLDRAILLGRELIKEVTEGKTALPRDKHGATLVSGRLIMILVERLRTKLRAATG